MTRTQQSQTNKWKIFFKNTVRWKTSVWTKVRWEGFLCLFILSAGNCHTSASFIRGKDRTWTSPTEVYTVGTKAAVSWPVGVYFMTIPAIHLFIHSPVTWALLVFQAQFPLQQGLQLSKTEVTGNSSCRKRQAFVIWCQAAINARRKIN